MATTTPKTKTPTDPQEIEALLQDCEKLMETIEQLRQLYQDRGDFAKMGTCAEAINQIKWACAYISHDRMDEAGEHLLAAKTLAGRCRA